MFLDSSPLPVSPLLWGWDWYQSWFPSHFTHSLWFRGGVDTTKELISASKCGPKRRAPCCPPLLCPGLCKVLPSDFQKLHFRGEHVPPPTPTQLRRGRRFGELLSSTTHWGSRSAHTLPPFPLGWRVIAGPTYAQLLKVQLLVDEFISFSSF